MAATDTITKSLHFSDAFVISCGTVTLDQAHHRILIMRYRETGEYLLPKGRKNIGETLEEAALRETLEETGHAVRLLPMRHKTLATSIDTYSTPELSTEPLAVTKRTVKGALKIIFWFYAQGDSAEAPQQKILKEDENFETMWVTYEDAMSMLSFEDDRSVCNRAVCETG